MKTNIYYRRLANPKPDPLRWSNKNKVLKKKTLWQRRINEERRENTNNYLEWKVDIKTELISI